MAFTTVGTGAEMFDTGVIRQIENAIYERFLVTSASSCPTWATSAGTCAVGDAVQAATFWAARQGAFATLITNAATAGWRFCEGGSTGSYPTAVSAFAGGSSVPTFASAAELWTKVTGSSSGPRRKTSMGASFSYGTMQTGDIIGPWIIEDLQLACKFLRWTVSANALGLSNTSWICDDRFGACQRGDDKSIAPSMSYAMSLFNNATIYTWGDTTWGSWSTYGDDAFYGCCEVTVTSYSQDNRPSSFSRITLAYGVQEREMSYTGVIPSSISHKKSLLATVGESSDNIVTGFFAWHGLSLYDTVVVGTEASWSTSTSLAALHTSEFIPRQTWDTNFPYSIWPSEGSDHLGWSYNSPRLVLDWDLTHT